MSKLLTATVIIEGTRPLLWNAFNVAAIPANGKRKKSGVAGNDPEEWKRTVLATPEGQLYVEPSYVFGCLRDAARYTKQGRSSLQSLLVATLQVLDERILLNRYLPNDLAGLSTDNKAPVYLDIRGVKNPVTRSRNIRYRVAASPGWEMMFHLAWDETIVGLGQLRAVLHDAGELVGFADGRQIGFGRFVVKDFEVTGQPS